VNLLLRSATAKATGVQGLVKCQCKTLCMSGRCSCKRQNVQCSSYNVALIENQLNHDLQVLNKWSRQWLLPFVCLFGVCLFVWWLFFFFESHEQFFIYLATVTITVDRAANLDLCLALMAFSSEGSFTCHTYCDTGPFFLKIISKRPVILTSECRVVGEGAITTYGLTRPARAGL
jgi:hypothetical protein